MEKEVNLHDEVARGKRASDAYNSYVKEHLDKTQERLFEAFVHLHPQDDAAIKHVKYLASAVEGLRSTILQDIETGTLARKQLEEQTDGRHN